MTDSVEHSPTIYIIAGPNGAGKTSFAENFLPDFVHCQEFLNADLIAAGLSPFSPESQAMAASQILLSRIRELVHRKRTFSFETTLAGRAYRQAIPEWIQAGYKLVLFFLWLPDVEIAIERVATRVQQGGHDIREPIIRRRFQRGLNNLFDLYLPVVQTALIYNASNLPPRLICERDQNAETIIDQAAWQNLNDTRNQSS